jgi:hypothetical protein
VLLIKNDLISTFKGMKLVAQNNQNSRLATLWQIFMISLDNLNQPFSAWTMRTPEGAQAVSRGYAKFKF